MLKLGLMGCGSVANYGHLPAIRKTAGLELVSIFDPDLPHLRETQRAFNVPRAFDDVRAFFDSGIDVVTIASTPTFHLENVLQAAEHHKHALCEKPLAMNEAEIEQMMAATKRAGVMLFTGLNHRFSFTVQHIKQLLEQGAIGELRDLRLIYNWDLHGKYQIAPDGTRIENPRRVARMNEGGPMVECGVHYIDLARWWLNSEVVRYSAHGVWVDEFHSPDHVYLHMDHACGAHTLVEMSFSYTHTAAEPRPRYTYDLIGTRGVIHCDREAKLCEVRNDQGTRHFEWSAEKEFSGMYQELVKAMKTGQPCDMPTARDGLIATRIAREVTEQAIRDRLR